MEFWQAVAFLETDQLLQVAEAAEDCDFDAVTVSDHIFFPKDLRSRYPYAADGRPFWSPDTPFPDPWVSIAAMAARTTRLRFTTNIYVAPARELFTVAKLVSSAAVLSGGRVALGAGAGWCQDEFDQTGQNFETRGARLDEMIGALRALWVGGMVSHHGRFYDFGPLQISPTPPEAIRILLGGDSAPALRRAARLGDGWIGNAYSAEQAGAVLDRLERALGGAGRSLDGFEVVLGLYEPPHPDLYRRFEARGVTALLCAPWMMAEVDEGESRPTLRARVTAMRRFADEVIAKMR